MITKEILRKMARSAEDFTRTEAKIDTSFAAGYGTVLFFEDTAVVKKLQASFPTYKESFPVWSQQTSAMHQLVIWTMLEDAGFGASLQHLIKHDQAVIKRGKLLVPWLLQGRAERHLRDQLPIRI